MTVACLLGCDGLVWRPVKSCVFDVPGILTGLGAVGDCGMRARACVADGDSIGMYLPKVEVLAARLSHEDKQNGHCHILETP